MSKVDGGGSPGVAGRGGKAGVAAPVAGNDAAPETDAWGVAAPDMMRDCGCGEDRVVLSWHGSDARWTAKADERGDGTEQRPCNAGGRRTGRDAFRGVSRGKRSRIAFRDALSRPVGRAVVCGWMRCDVVEGRLEPRSLSRALVAFFLLGA